MNDVKKESEVETYWTNVAKRFFMGKTIVGVRYVSKEEAESMGWYSRSLALMLDNGQVFFISSDDEGNDGGSIFCGDGQVFPVIP